MDVFLFTGGPAANGIPAARSALPKAWRRYPTGLHIWRRNGWRSMGGGAEFAVAVGPELGLAVETFKRASAQQTTGELGIIRTQAEGLAPAHAARKTAHALRAALHDNAGQVVGAFYDGPDPDKFAADLRVSLNLPALQVFTNGEPGDTVTPIHPAPPQNVSMPRFCIRTGRLLARAIAANPQPKPPTQFWIWNSRQYQAWAEGISPSTPAAMVTLPHAHEVHGFFKYGFGQAYFSKRDFPTVYVRCAKSRWFQDEEALDVMAAIRARLGPEIRLTTYGASMGGYGALTFSGVLEAETAIAIAPQFSIDPGDVPGETRWRGSANRINGFIHDMAKLARPATRKVVIYDRMGLDKLQIDRLPVDHSWEVVNLPFASHQVTGFLAETKTLDKLLENCPGKGPDLTALKALSRGRRRQSSVYWRELHLMARKRRPAWSATFKAKWQALKHGTPG
ncbi:MAG: hypothetical protein ACPG4X_10235 [Pikeienuella sp.]